MKTALKAGRLLIVPGLVLALGACDDDTTQPTVEQTIVDVAVDVSTRTGEDGERRHGEDLRDG